MISEKQTIIYKSAHEAKIIFVVNERAFKVMPNVSLHISAILRTVVHKIFPVRAYPNVIIFGPHFPNLHIRKSGLFL